MKLLLLILSLMQLTTQPATESSIRRGAFHATFTEQDPRSVLEAQNKRYHIGIEANQRYDLKDESFEVYVPPDYDPAHAYGLFVWVNAGGRGSMPRDWQGLMDKHKLIFISANNSGNDRGVAIRLGLALDAVLNLQKLYNIDAARIYTGGISGGGRCASMLAVIYPETFSGCVPICAVSYFRDIPLPTDPKKFWQANYPQPALTVLDRAKQMVRYEIITGSNDINHDSVKATYDAGFAADKFEHAELIDVPGMGHEIAPLDTMNAALDKLDEPLPTLMDKLLAIAQQSQRQKRFIEAKQLFQAVILHGDQKQVDQATVLMNKIDVPPPAAAVVNHPTTSQVDSPETEAQKLLSLAENYERAKLYAKARQRAEEIIQNYPTTSAAGGAKQMLQRLPAQ